MFRFQPDQASPASQVPTSPPQFNSFNLLNPTNFAAFDAQFGGSVPTNPGASQLPSNVFSQPGSQLLQGNDIVVNPTSVFGGFGQSNIQSGAFSVRTG